ncbi:putative regulatory protein cox [Escherichia coli 3-475-03_S1_C2]|nr:putative regulatory protein cox [Escherichia coli 3-475-03_S1_C2]
MIEMRKGNYQLLRLLTLSQYRGVLVNIGYTFRHGITD